MMSSSRTPSKISPLSEMERFAGRIVPVCIIFVIAVSVSSCDFLRRMAGRPTGEELAALASKRDSLLQAEKMRLERQSLPDTLSAAGQNPDGAAPGQGDAVQIAVLKEKAGNLYMRSLSQFKGCAEADALFYVIAGTFREPENVRKFTSRTLSDGFSGAQTLHLGSGLYLTSVYSTDKADDALAFLSKFKALLPAEAWVLINDQR